MPKPPSLLTCAPRYHRQIQDATVNGHDQGNLAHACGESPDAANAAQRVGVNDRDILLAQEPWQEVERHEIATDGNDLVFALPRDAQDWHEGVETFDAMAGGGERIFFDASFDARAIDDGFDVVLAQAGE